MAAKRERNEKADRMSSVVTARFAPKLRFGLTLIARTHRENLSRALTTCVEIALRNAKVPDGEFAENALERVWLEEPSARFVELAMVYPELLTGAEQRMWATLEARFRKGRSIDREAVKKHWAELVAKHLDSRSSSEWLSDSTS